MRQRPVRGHVHARERRLEDLEAVAVRHEEDHVALARAFDALDRARRAFQDRRGRFHLIIGVRRIDGVPRPNLVVRRVRAQLKGAEVAFPQRRLGLDVSTDGGRRMVALPWHLRCTLVGRLGWRAFVCLLVRLFV